LIQGGYRLFDIFIGRGRHQPPKKRLDGASSNASRMG
jgi:hypothetical protein